MSTPPPIYVGPGSQASCAAACEACAAAKVAKAPLKSVAEEFGVARSTLRRMVLAHKAMRHYDVQLERDGTPTMRVCQVVTPKGAMAAAVAAFREYPGTLKNLELPGWKLVAGDVRFLLADVRREASMRHGGA